MCILGVSSIAILAPCLKNEANLFASAILEILLVGWVIIQSHETKSALRIAAQGAKEEK